MVGRVINMKVGASESFGEIWIGWPGLGEVSADGVLPAACSLETWASLAAGGRPGRSLVTASWPGWRGGSG